MHAALRDSGKGRRHLNEHSLLSLTTHISELCNEERTKEEEVAEKP